MLVLGREVGESIILHTQDGEITILVVRVKDQAVRIGVDAPKNVNIRRGEIEIVKREAGK